ncbi:MAG: PEP-CTERM system TPR-repeat protein PrsT [Alphaproteobacteria bacterium]|nr:PEP-CTERM system TPR-repeat protein PrsT [Alphaproteobacteria bacterium]MDP6517340.1 PEP-CTERM system TPR-repeat protein PrsT [Alphaproteobacteria bacterium]
MIDQRFIDHGLSVVRRLAWAVAGLAAVVMITTPAPSLARVSDESISFYENARQHLEKGEFQAAVIELKNAIRASPDNVEARYDLALIYLRTGDGPSAEKELKAARDRGMDEVNVLLPLAAAYSLQNKHQNILDEIEPEDHPSESRPPLMVARAFAHIALDDVESAEAELSAAVTLAPDYAKAYVGLSRIQEARGDLAAAESNLDRALELTPEDPEALIRKAELLRIGGDLAGAETFGTKAIELNPGNIRARLVRAIARIGLGKDAAAREDIDAVLAAAPDQSMAVYLRALLLARAQQYSEAIDVVRPARDALMSYPPALYLLASLSFTQGEVQQAQTYAQRFLVEFPDSLVGQKLLAAIYLRQNAPDKAIPMLEPLVAADPEDVQAAALLGNAYMASGRHDEAATLFGQAVALDPANTDTRTGLALSRLSAGNREEAVAEFETILEQDPGAGRANILLVLTHIRSGEYDRALTAASALQQQMPDSSIPDNFLGTIHAALGDADAARASFQRAIDKQPDFFPAALNLAAMALSSGDADDARSRYQAIIARDEDNQQAMIALAQLEFGQNQIEDGIAWLERAAEANPKSPTPLLRLVNVQLDRNQADHALIVARQLIDIAPDNPDALDALARAQFRSGEQGSAVTTYRKLVSLVPDSALVQHRLGRVLAATEDLEGARDAFDLAIGIDPSLMPAWRDRIDIEVRLGDADSALTIAETLARDHPESGLGPALIGDLLQRAKKYKPAADAYRQSLDRESSGAVFARFYRSLVEGGELERGRTLLKQWIADNPEDSEIRFLWASELIREGRYADAVTENEFLLERFPDNPALLNDLAWLYDRTGDSRALEYAERAHELAPTSPAIADTLGWLLVANDQAERGLELLKAARAGAPNHPEIGYHFAVALVETGNKVEGRIRLKAVLDSGKPFEGIEDAKTLYESLTQ